MPGALGCLALVVDDVGGPTWLSSSVQPWLAQLVSRSQTYYQSLRIEIGKDLAVPEYWTKVACSRHYQSYHQSTDASGLIENRKLKFGRN